MSMFKLSNKTLSRDLYESFIDKDHFLAQLDWRLNWDDLALPLNDLAKNAEGGRPSYPPVLMIKMLFLSFLFDLSDRDTEFFATNNLLAKYFLRLPINETAPDHTTVCRFRDAVLKEKGEAFFLTLFRDVMAQAKERGIVFGSIHALDATHTIADVNTFEDGTNVKHYEGKHRDPDAAWGVKGSETKVTPEGKKIEVLKTFYGYKSHILGETTHGLITGIYTTPGNIADIDGGDWLVNRVLLPTEIKNTPFITADKGYGCPVWINLLEKYTGITTAFHLPEYLLNTGDYQEHWKHYYEQDENRKTIRKERYIIERINADVKNNHSLRRCRYLGKTKYAYQAIMASIAHNVKTIVTLLSGAKLRPI